MFDGVEESTFKQRGRINDEHVWWPDVARDLSREEQPFVVWCNVNRQVREDASDEVSEIEYNLEPVSRQMADSIVEPHDCGHKPFECEHRARKAVFWDDTGLEPHSEPWNFHVIDLALQLKRHGVIDDASIPGRSFTIVPKSSCIKQVSQLVDDIALKHPSSIVKSGGNVVYVPDVPMAMLGLREHPERAAI